MKTDVGETMLAIATAVIGLAIISVVLSKNATTASVIQSFATGFSQILNVVVSPITGGSNNSSLPKLGG